MLNILNWLIPLSLLGMLGWVIWKAAKIREDL